MDVRKLSEVSLCLGVILSLLTFCAAVDTIAANQTIKDGDTIVSAGNNFELGFFSPNASEVRYLGIWYKRISFGTVVWIANKGSPINDTSGEFKLNRNGTLQVLSHGGVTVVWASSSGNIGRATPVAQLLDTGNLVVRYAIDQENIIWESNPSHDYCVHYGICGSFGTCNNNLYPSCSCLAGFEPKYPKEWEITDWSGGCIRVVPLDCVKDNFMMTSGIKLPDSQNSWYNVSMTLDECQATCERNCSCTAFASLDIQSGCLLWFGDLEDIRENSGGRELYVRMRMTASELEVTAAPRKNKKVIKVALSTSVSLLVACLILALYAWRKKKRSSTSKKGKPAQTLEEDFTNESQKEPAELPSFSLDRIMNSTNNFSINNKLGQGGFGPVYKGVMEGREIAVKRLSKTSSQGFDEFKNEVRCIAKLQHRNLVKLMGYCIQGDEFLLIYEYMPNKSLDLFIFDEVKSLMLDWPSRFHIIQGIARGLLYLHQDSRLRIIHRDLKAGNILLDQAMNPKISDFGLARRFHGQENDANTNKVVGTLGYISPEYAANGHFSIKSDVFSFGVLLLEIVSGKKNRGFTHQDHNDNLLGHAWRLYKAGKSLELLSGTLCNSCVDYEVLRTIHIGLLCVQDHAEDRPTMMSVISMFNNDGPLPPPKQPAYFTEKTVVELNLIPSVVSPPASANCVTITLLDGR